jgi:hypothetical protein
VWAKVIGGLRMIDKGQADDKIIAVLVDDATYGEFDDISECPPGLIKKLEHYFLTYKTVPGSKSKVQIAGQYGRDEAFKVIEHSRADYDAKYGSPEARLEQLRQLLFQSLLSDQAMMQMLAQKLFSDPTVLQLLVTSLLGDDKLKQLLAQSLTAGKK